MRSDHQKRVDEFMRLANQEVPANPIEPSLEVRKLRAKLILEEALETIQKGLGVDVCIEGPQGYIPIDEKTVRFGISWDFNMEETIDGCCDIKVVTTGTLSAIGVPDEPFQREVDNNNLAKFGPGGHRREDGKWVKPPDHKPPKIAEILRGVSAILTGPQGVQEETPHKQTPHEEFKISGMPVSKEIKEAYDKKVARALATADAIKKEQEFAGKKLIKSDFGTFLILRLDNPDEKLAHASRQAARLFAKEIWHSDNHRQLSEEISTAIRSIEEELPPLKSPQ